MANSTSVIPNNVLTLPNPPPPPEKSAPTPPNRFIMFGDSWLQMQTFVAMTLKLPISGGDFKTKYGSFADQSLVTGCVQAMKDVRGLSGTFGDPSTIKQKIITDGSYLTSAKPPPELYGHIVWMAMQIENAASTFNYTFANLGQLLSPSAGTPQQRADNLKMILAGDGGLVSTANDMHAKVSELSSLLAAFDTQITDAITQMQAYSGKSSKILKDANDLAAKYAKDVTTYQEAADKAYEAWKNYTIAAVTSSVLLTVLSGGLLWPVALGLGIGLGVAAAKQRSAYNTAMSNMKTAQKDEAQKVLLVTDLTGLNAKMPGTLSAVQQFGRDLAVIEGVWTGIAGTLSYIVSSYSVDQLSSLPWVQQAFKIGDATNKWKGISTTAQQFTQHSLVSFSSDVSFGEQIPDAA